MKQFFPGLFLILGTIFYLPHLSGNQSPSFADGKTLILYDAASGTIPDSSLLPFTAFPSDAASLQFSDGITIMDSSISGNDGYAGWIASQATSAGFPILDGATGIQLNFTMQVESETHNSRNRSGFSLILLDKDAKGIELSFWENEIWAQNDDQTGGLFKHGEGVPFQTNRSLTDYQLTIAGETYNLSANSKPILSGPIRDYSKFNGFPDPYETPNFLFFGDDTTSSQSRIKLRFVSVAGTEPDVPTATQAIYTDTPLPLASDTALPGATSIPLASPTPTGRGIQLCPSSWILVAAMIASTITIKRSRHGRTKSGTP
jgi:hypothetical protein